MPLSIASFCLVLFWLSCLGGCASTVHTPPRVQTPFSPAATAQSIPSPQISQDAAVFTAGSQGPVDLERLAQLWHKRTQEGAASDYPIGPGDVLEISVPAMEELSSRTVRVSGDGMISLPFVGTVQAGGLTEKGLREEIRHRLEENYMHGPQVNLFVKEYRSRQVAVIGAVEKPGLYNLAGGADTILDMISLAGGITKEAAPRIHFIPAEPVENEKAKELASLLLPVQLVGKGSSPLILKGADPIVIDLKSLTKGGDQIYLALPARPGDVIMIPGSGEVLVEGWVERPGSYRITSGLTVLGAVAAAGGPMFAADTSSVRIIRTGEQGEKITYVADLEKIKHKESPDVPVEESDVIEVFSSTPKLVSYGMFRVFASVFHVGTYMGF